MIGHIKNLSWRLDALLQTRAQLVKKPAPIFTVEILTNEGKSMTFEADPKLMKDLTTDLESALKIMKGKDARKLQRNI